MLGDRQGKGPYFGKMPDITLRILESQHARVQKKLSHCHLFSTGKLHEPTETINCKSAANERGTRIPFLFPDKRL